MKPMTKSPLQIARANYQPKLPAALLGNVAVVEGAATESVADQADIKNLFPNTYGMPLLKFEPGEKKTYPQVNVGVILSGGQAPGLRARAGECKRWRELTAPCADGSARCAAPRGTWRRCGGRIRCLGP